MCCTIKTGVGKPAGSTGITCESATGPPVDAMQRAMRDAGGSLREAPAKPARKRGKGRAVIVLGLGAVLAVALSEGLRTKVLDMLFGAEEQFDYSSTTAPATPEPAVAGA